MLAERQARGEAAGLSRKAALLLAVLRRRGGGIIDEYLLRDGTGLSHGSIVAARRELLAGGQLQLAKQNRKLVYILTGQKGAEPPLPPAAHGAGLPPAAVRPPEGAGTAGFTAAAAIPQTAAAGTLATAGQSPAARGVPEAVPEAGPLPLPDRPQEGLETEAEDTGFARLIEPMERVTGRFASLDEWTDALIDTLGGNIDITESLVDDGSYEIHSYDHQSDDRYLVTVTSDGIIVE